MNRLPLGDEAEYILEPSVVPQDIREDHNHHGQIRRTTIVERFF